MTIGLALSGGGIRGIAHIGVLKVIEEYNIEIKCISGTSSGSLIGALYAGEYNADEILNLARKYSILSLMSPAFSLLGLSSLDGIEKVFKELLPENSFKSLKIPLYVSVTDLFNGSNEIKTEGNLSKIVKASCSIPVIFKPEIIDDIAYADGGIMNNLPANAIRSQVDILIGVNLIANPHLDKSTLNTAFKVGARTFELSVFQNSQESLKRCDIKIQPAELSKIPIFRHKNVDEIYEIGYRAGTVAIQHYLEEHNDIRLG